jgi:hypothetical protein
MKKLLLLVISAIVLFANNNDEVNKKLNTILERMNKMEQKLNMKDKEIEKLKTEVHQQGKEAKETKLVNNCKNIKVLDFSYKYYGPVIETYDLKYTLKNLYPYDIAEISGKIYIKDRDKTTILTDYVNKKVNISKNSTINITKNHLISGDLERTLKDEKPNSLIVTFVPINITFSNGKQAKCSPGLFW